MAQNAAALRRTHILTKLARISPKKQVEFSFGEKYQFRANSASQRSQNSDQSAAAQ
jgi:hypothetical protein